MPEEGVSTDALDLQLGSYLFGQQVANDSRAQSCTLPCASRSTEPAKVLCNRSAVLVLDSFGDCHGAEAVLLVNAIDLGEKLIRRKRPFGQINKVRPLVSVAPREAGRGGQKAACRPMTTPMSTPDRGAVIQV
jgi:hypothetical protein